ncbi:MAG: calcium/sodium antiporter [Candidatus Micrarchaeota archaeon]|nr:calcium/sodium antiporter [Candidatus Micrarchaeota archaeon]
MALVELTLLLVFIIILLKSAEHVVISASRLADFFGISTLAIGVILVAFSTSLPELSVGIISSINNKGSISAGNVFGSNIANICLILGLGAFLYGFSITMKEIKQVVVILILTTIISVYIIFHVNFYGDALTQIEGIILLGIGFWYFRNYLKDYGTDNHHNSHNRNELEHVTKHKALQEFLYFFVGILIVLFSSSMVVRYAVKLAEMVGLAESFIGATLIAVGTSLPEMTVSLQAIRKKKYGLALGDAIGANLTTLTIVLGSSAVINPIDLTLNVFIAALLFAIIANSLFLYFAITSKKLGNKEGMILIALYVFYLVTIFGLQATELVT